jgi:hypothetical protein
VISHAYRRSRHGMSLGSAWARKRRPHDGLQADGGQTDVCPWSVQATIMGRFPLPLNSEAFGNMEARNRRPMHEHH